MQGGRETRDLGAVELAVAVEELGAGEILLNNIDNDGACAVRPLASSVRLLRGIVILLNNIDNGAAYDIRPPSPPPILCSCCAVADCAERRWERLRPRRAPPCVSLVLC